MPSNIYYLKTDILIVIFVLPGWWNGRHAGFRYRCSKECASSNLVPGIIVFFKYLIHSITSELHFFVKTKLFNTKCIIDIIKRINYEKTH